ncbi:MAG: S1 RNA-binding domain-containing protein, partial [Rhodospirillales bacterium]|nr:S1 RNA-binding domain-containing protein [Rhodospirillales bacterium]
VDAEFHGRIAGVTRFGIFVSLDETGAEGLVPARSLGGTRPRFDARRHTLAVDGRILRLGDPVVVALREADPIAGGLVFSLSAVNGEAWASTADRDGRRRGRPRRRR